MNVFLILTVALGAALVGRAAPATGQAGPAPEERIAALKQSLQENAKQLRQYEWIETTITSLKGEEKSRKQAQCYYGVDGKVQKVPVAAAPPPESGGGRRGGRIKQAVIENKKEEMQEYMQAAVSLVHQYVPPNPADIDKAKKASNVAARPLAAGGLRLEFNNYIKPGDQMNIDVDIATNRLLAVTVASYMEKPDDAVALAVQFARLPDGTNYTAQTTLDAPAKKVKVVVQNTGYRPASR